MVKVKSFKSIGKQQAYDLEVDHPDHQFYLANGLLTSNSHALSYAIDSYQCAWLLTYFEPEWLCAYMETQAEVPDKRAKAISELKSFGYEIVKVDVNHATDKWTIMPGKKFMPSFLTVKGIGAAAIQEIELNRPYKSLNELLWNSDGTWRHSKFNKRSLESLIKLGAFESMNIVGKGKLFSSYQAMYKCVIEDNNKLKHKTKGKLELIERLKQYRDTPEWSKAELIAFSKELVGSFDIGLVFSKKLRDKLEELKIPSIDEFENRGIYWFVAEDVAIKTTKGGKEYALLTATASTGKRHKIFAWGFNSDKHELFPNTAFVSELEKSQFGFSTQVFKLKAVTPRKQKVENESE